MTSSMTAHEIEIELARQAAAEQREAMQSGSHDDPSIDKYRLINRVLKKSDIPDLPADFIARVMQQVQDFEEQADFESKVFRVLVAIALITGLLFAIPAMVGALQKVATGFSIPWPMLWATVTAFGFAVVIDKASKQYRSTHF